MAFVKSAHLSLGILPFLSISLLLSVIPTIVPAASKTSTNNNEKMTLIIDRSKAVSKSSCKNTGSTLGGFETIPWKVASPLSQPIKDTPSMPIIIAPGIFFESRATIVNKPIRASIGAALDRLPVVTKVEVLACTIEAFWSAIKARNNPMPAVIACLRFFGIELMIQSLIGRRLMIRNKQPERKTVARAVCQECPIPMTME